LFFKLFRDFSTIVDLTWGGWDDIQLSAANNGFPYLRIEATNFQFVQVSISPTFYQQLFLSEVI